jgi:hypothetical protein
MVEVECYQVSLEGGDEPEQTPSALRNVLITGEEGYIKLQFQYHF